MSLSHFFCRFNYSVAVGFPIPLCKTKLYKNIWPSRASRIISKTRSCSRKIQDNCVKLRFFSSFDHSHPTEKMIYNHNYRPIRKQIKTATKREYREYLKNLQSDVKDIPKKFCNFYRSKTTSARILKVVHFGSVKASNPAAKGNLFNHFFASA